MIRASTTAAEVARIGRRMAAERGLSFIQATPGGYVTGRLAGAANTASGRFAMIEEGEGFQLIPWQTCSRKRIGQHITGIARDNGGIELNFGRKWVLVLRTSVLTWTAL